MPSRFDKRVALSFGDPAKLPPYERALRVVGLEPVLNPESLDDSGGLVLAGGTDVNPELYGQTKAPETQDPDIARDTREQRLIREALDRNLPVLAICRGMQMLNVTLGGTLTQHLPNAAEHVRRTHDPSEPAHDVVLAPDAMLSQVLEGNRIPVNSRHHQAVRMLSPSLRVSAVSPRDHVIEAVEMPDRRFVFGVQWHPEDRIDCDADRRLFESFARALAGT